MLEYIFIPLIISVVLLALGMLAKVESSDDPPSEKETPEWDDDYINTE